MKHRFLSSFTCLLILGLLLILGCKKEDDKSCVEYVKDEFDDYERVRVMDYDVYYIFTQRDTAIFSYTGHDTLVFEVMDSAGGVIDTVKFFGQGKQRWFNNIGPYMINDVCRPTMYEEIIDIAFFPGDTSYDKLLFKMNARLGSASINYKFERHHMSALSTDINWVEFVGYRKIYEVRGRQFYNVAYYIGEYPTETIEYYMNKEHALFLFGINRNRWLLKIN